MSKIVLIVRETLGVGVQTLIDSNDKRKNIIERFSDFPEYPNNIILKKIDGMQMTGDEFVSFFNDVKGAMSDDDILYFIDDRASSLMSSSDFLSLNEELEDILDEDIDVLYLSNAMDNCNSFDVVYPTSLSNIKFYKAKTPKGLLGLVSTKQKWENIMTLLNDKKENKAMARMNSLVVGSDIIAATSWPRIIQPNIFMIEKDSTDNFFTYPCRIEDNFGKSIPNVENVSFYWFCLGSLFFILLIWVMMKLHDHTPQ